jgi:hypothetical protein
MHTFDHVLNWTLKQGSHLFPGPDGGTCINEAAIVAAGFPYQRVTTPADMPDCFSRPICGLAMVLNDQANDNERQLLLPYVTRLACADTLEVERARSDYINQQMGWSSTGSYAVEMAFSSIGTTIILASRRSSAGFDKGLQVLEGALAIGRQADLFPADEMQARMEAIRPRTTEQRPAPARPFFSKVKEWLVEGPET